MASVHASGGSARATPTRRAQQRRVNTLDEDGDSEVEAVQTTSHATPSRKTSSRSAINDEDGSEGLAASASGTPAPVASSRSHGKRRRLSGSGRAAREESEEQDDVVGDEDEDTPPPVPSGSRGSGSRARARDGQSDEPEVDPLMAEEDEEDRKKPNVKQPKQLLVRDPDDGYAMGSIVRIRCHNFLTYSDIECHPGPHLNMIFGPNGSGKSSLVAAIALGLGFPPKIMQRGKNLSSFVKQGTEDGWVVIELKGRPGKANLVVKRSFSVRDNASQFEIRGKKVTAKEVHESVERLHVNINNLCSFMPQDRVADFAKMTGPELLQETQRTADEALLDQQEQLAKLKDKLSSAGKDLAKNQRELAENEKKMAGLEKDVKRHKERQKLEDAVLLHECALPYAQYQEAKNAYEQARRDKNMAKSRLDALADQNAPLVDQQQQLKGYVKLAEERRKALSKRRDRIVRQQSKTMTAAAKIEAEVETIRSDLKDIKKAENVVKAKIKAAEAEIKSIQAKLDAGPPQEELPEIDAEVAQLSAHMRSITSELREIAAQHEQAENSKQAAVAERRRLQQQLEGLSNVQRRREDQCKQEDAELFTAACLARDHIKRGTFRSAVYDPIRLLVNVKDKAHARIAEAAINYAAMKTFISLDKDDYAWLGNNFTKYTMPNGQVRDLRVNVAQLPEERRDLSQYTRPCSEDELREWGFDAFVIDLLDGPPDVLAYLCYANNLHRVPVAFDDGQRVHQERIRHPNSPFRRYITQHTVTDIQFSKYGRREAILQDSQSREPRIFGESIDQNRKRELEQKVAQADDSVQADQDTCNKLAARDAKLREDFEEAKRERTDKERATKAIKEKLIAFEKLGLDLKNKTVELQRLQSVPSAEATRAKMASQMKSLSLDRLRLARTLQDYASLLVKCHAIEATPLLAQLQATASLHALDSEIMNRNDETKALRDQLTRCSAIVQETKVLATNIYTQADRGKDRIPDRLADAFQGLLSNLTDSAETMAQQLQDLQSQLDMSQSINPGVVRRYEQLKETVETLQATVADQENSAKTARSKIEKLHSKWHPRIQEIAKRVHERFSAAMTSLGCLGEVSIAEDEDYNKWAISIRVAFRDGEDLAELTPYRQSGGERSLTTMLYLISLLQLSKVPFSLVDEINQGMDARAERAVHNHLVKAVCDNADVGQYFLLTPKLLTNLNYHAKIKILCVNNGEWLPDELPLRKLIDRKMAARGLIRPAASVRVH